MDCRYRKHVVKKDDRVKKKLLADPKALEMAREANALDIALYEHVSNIVFPRCCAEAGVSPGDAVPTYNTFATKMHLRYQLGSAFNKLYRATRARKPRYAPSETADSSRPGSVAHTK